jgi:hypothetical protein
LGILTLEEMQVIEGNHVKVAADVAALKLRPQLPGAKGFGKMAQLSDDMAILIREVKLLKGWA